jgi:hypothetical protein
MFCSVREIITERATEFRSGRLRLRRALGWQISTSGLRIEKQRNNDHSCDLLVAVEKADLSKIRFVIWIE